MKVLKKRNYLQSINQSQDIINNNFNYISKNLKYPNQNNDYINPIIYNNTININKNKNTIPLINNNNYYYPCHTSKFENENIIKAELYNKMNHFLISNALKSEITFSNLFKEYIPKKIEFLEDKTRMHIDLE